MAGTACLKNEIETSSGSGQGKLSQLASWCKQRIGCMGYIHSSLCCAVVVRAGVALQEGHRLLRHRVTWDSLPEA